MDVEYMLTERIAKIGGVHVRTIVGESPEFDNADFFFKSSNVVAELKSLDEDLICTPSFIERATAIHLEAQRADPTSPIAFGSIELTTSGRPGEFAKKIQDLYYEPFKRCIKKANKQIKLTAKHLRLEAQQGLVVIANNNHTGLDPGHAKVLLDELFLRERFQGVNSVVYLSAGQGIRVIGERQRHDIFMEYRNPHVPELDRWFLDRFRAIWMQTLSAHRGYEHFTAQAVNTELLAAITNRPK